MAQDTPVAGAWMQQYIDFGKRNIWRKVLSSQVLGCKRVAVAGQLTQLQLVSRPLHVCVEGRASHTDLLSDVIGGQQSTVNS